MKKTLNLLLALLLPAAVCLPVSAGDAAPKEGAASTDTAKPSKPAAKKPAPKKKAKKKKKPAPVNEYKFGAVEKTETYKFDREANPIVKQKKAPPKKKAAKPAPGTTGVGSDASGAEPEVN